MREKKTQKPNNRRGGAGRNTDRRAGGAGAPRGAAEKRGSRGTAPRGESLRGAGSRAPRGFEMKGAGPGAGAGAFSEAGARTDLIAGRNPVTEALRSGRDMERIFVQEGSGGSLGRLIALAKERGVMVAQTTKQKLDEMTGGASHQGVAAVVSAHSYADVEDILSLAESRGEDPFIIILDGIEDPHNLGAIMRTAECAGAHGVIIQKRRAVGLTEIVAKTSAGAIEYLPCARVANTAQTIDMLKERNIWVYACDMDGSRYDKAALTGPVALVVGAEGSGVSRLVREKCDGIVSIPMVGKISSLNASNAAAILMYEIRRQRDLAGAVK